MIQHQTKIWLSKSSYLRSLQCEKSFYLYKNYYQYRDQPSEKTKLLFQEGHNIELIAKNSLFPGGIDLRPKNPKSWKQSIEITGQLIRNNQPVIYEAAFNHKGVMCAVDICVVENQALSIYEIKRGSEVKEIYLKDIALQYWVLAGLNYTIKDFCIINYVGDRDKSENYSSNDFKLTSVLKESQKRKQQVEKQIQKAERISNYGIMPEVDMGSHCYSPYDCDFISFCSKQASQKHHL